ncbi:MAG TPA: hypothetical protein VJV87_02675, partial [Sphingomicrobium sp.]|nr:hypothetical protein [Sphingomicrobium sp.]
LEPKEPEQFGFVEVEIHPFRLADPDDRIGLGQVGNKLFFYEVAGDRGFTHLRCVVAAQITFAAQADGTSTPNF